MVTLTLVEKNVNSLKIFEQNDNYKDTEGPNRIEEHSENGGVP